MVNKGISLKDNAVSVSPSILFHTQKGVQVIIGLKEGRGGKVLPGIPDFTSNYPV